MGRGNAAVAIAATLLLLGTPRGDAQDERRTTTHGTTERAPVVVERSEREVAWLKRMAHREHALLQACLDAGEAMGRLDEETVYVAVSSADECGADQESLRRAAEGEFLRGRIQTERVWLTGQLSAVIRVFCVGTEDQVAYSTQGRNSIVGFGDSNLVLATTGRFGSVPATIARQDILDSVQRVAEDLVTDLLERQKKAKTTIWCD